MRLTLLFILCFGGVTLLYGQIALPSLSPSLDQRTRPNQPAEIDLNGIWTGELLQNPGGIAERFEFSMQLKHNGIFMQGTSFVRFGEVFVEMELSGYRQPNGTWKLTETKILRGEKPENLSWCIKRFELRIGYTKEGVLLTGPWWGNSEFGPCVPGSVHLIKKVKSA